MRQAQRQREEGGSSSAQTFQSGNWERREVTKEVPRVEQKPRQTQESSQ